MPSVFHTVLHSFGAELVLTKVTVSATKNWDAFWVGLKSRKCSHQQSTLQCTSGKQKRK